MPSILRGLLWCLHHPPVMVRFHWCQSHSCFLHAAKHPWCWVIIMLRQRCQVLHPAELLLPTSATWVAPDPKDRREKSRVRMGEWMSLDLGLFLLSLNCVMQIDPTQVVIHRSFPVHAEYNSQCVCIYIYFCIYFVYINHRKNTKK